MQNKLPRRKIADYVAEQYEAGARLADLLDQVAAYLAVEGRLREADLVVRAIEDALAARGIVVASIASAHTLTDAERSAIIKLIDAPRVELRETIEPELLGGVRIETPGRRLDATIQNKLIALRGAKL